MINHNFAVFILTHGRADKVITYNTLRKCGYTGKIYLLVDSFDKQIDRYKKLYGEHVIVFDKQKAIDMTDSGDNQQKHNSVVYARNYNFIVAKDLGIDYFLQLDDDYYYFGYRILIDDKNSKGKTIRNFDDVCTMHPLPTLKALVLLSQVFPDALNSNFILSGLPTTSHSSSISLVCLTTFLGAPFTASI